MINLLPSTSVIFVDAILELVINMFILGHPPSAPGFSIWVSFFQKCAMIEKAIWSESSESLVSFSLGGWQVDTYSAKLFSELETLKV